MALLYLGKNKLLIYIMRDRNHFKYSWIRIHIMEVVMQIVHDFNVMTDVARLKMFDHPIMLCLNIISIGNKGV